MKKQLLFIFCLLLAGGTHGKCLTNDSWTGIDKAAHFGSGAAIGAAGTMLSKGNVWVGIGAGTIVAVAKESYDAGHPQNHTCSVQDAAATIAGSALGAWATKVTLFRRNGVIYAAYKTEF